MSSDLVELECEDLPKVILLSSKLNANPEIKKIFLDFPIQGPQSVFGKSPSPKARINFTAFCCVGKG